MSLGHIFIRWLSGPFWETVQKRFYWPCDLNSPSNWAGRCCYFKKRPLGLFPQWPWLIIKHLVHVPEYIRCSVYYSKQHVWHLNNYLKSSVISNVLNTNNAAPLVLSIPGCVYRWVNSRLLLTKFSHNIYLRISRRSITKYYPRSTRCN